MSDLERYLRAATRGLRGSKRAEVGAELEEHVLERAHGLHLLGLKEEEAISRALRELGPPARVAGGMGKVYLMPYVLKTSLIGGLLVSAALSAIPTGAAQVAALTRRPVTPTCAQGGNRLRSGRAITLTSHKGNTACYTFNDLNVYNGVYLNLDSLAGELRKKGVKVERQKNRTFIRFPGATSSISPIVRFVRNGTPFASLEETALHFGSVGLPVDVKGWTNPTLTVGDTSFQVGTANSPVTGAVLYEALMIDLRGELLPGDTTGTSDRVQSKPKTFAHTLRVNAPAGSVVGLLMRDERGVPFVDAGPVQPNGTVTLYAPRRQLAFVGDPKALTPYLAGGRAQALLLALNGRVDRGMGAVKRYSVIQPGDVR